MFKGVIQANYSPQRGAPTDTPPNWAHGPVTGSQRGQRFQTYFQPGIPDWRKLFAMDDGSGGSVSITPSNGWSTNEDACSQASLQSTGPAPNQMPGAETDCCYALLNASSSPASTTAANIPTYPNDCCQAVQNAGASPTIAPSTQLLNTATSIQVNPPAAQASACAIAQATPPAVPSECCTTAIMDCATVASDSSPTQAAIQASVAATQPVTSTAVAPSNQMSYNQLPTSVMFPSKFQMPSTQTLLYLGGAALLLMLLTSGKK